MIGKNTRTSSEVSRRKFTNKYFLNKDGKRRQVCQAFFLSTFDLSESFIRRIQHKRKEHNFILLDGRGRHKPGIFRSEEGKRKIRDHINSLPVLLSHYAREDSDKTYLCHDLNLRIVYRLYVANCEENRFNQGKEWLYTLFLPYAYK